MYEVDNPSINVSVLRSECVEQIPDPPFVTSRYSPCKTLAKETHLHHTAGSNFLPDLPTNSNSAKSA